MYEECEECDKLQHVTIEKKMEKEIIEIKPKTEDLHLAPVVTPVELSDGHVDANIDVALDANNAA